MDTNLIPLCFYEVCPHCTSEHSGRQGVPGISKTIIITHLGNTKTAGNSLIRNQTIKFPVDRILHKRRNGQ